MRRIGESGGGVTFFEVAEYSDLPAADSVGVPAQAYVANEADYVALKISEPFNWRSLFTRDLVAGTVEQTVVDDDFSGGSPQVVYDFSVNAANAYISGVGLTTREGGGYTLEIRKGGVVLQSESFTGSSTGTESFEFTYDKSDYAELYQPGDSGTVEIAGGDINRAPADSFSGDVLDITNEEIQTSPNLIGYSLKADGGF